MRIRNVFALLVAALLLGTAVLAQMSTSRITGTVQDQTGAVIPSAKVTVTNEFTGAKYEARATESGNFAFDALIVGSYTVTVEAQGFKKWVSTKNALSVGTPLVVNATLQVGESSSVVTVESAAEVLNTSDASIGDTITRRAIQNLPLNGRNPLNLITLEPGLIQRSTGGAGSGTHINGSRDRAFNITLDGIDMNEPSVPNPQSNTFRLTTDNVQEYRIVTSNATAEFGRNSGANVAMASRSGTNEIHGNVYEYFRNPVLNANDYFNNLQNVEKPDFKVHQFGADAGGPVFKDKTFWFASWQTTRLVFTQPIAEVFGTPIIYTASARQGIYRYVRGTVTLPNGTTRNSNSTALVDSQGNLLPGIAVCGGAITNNCIESVNIATNDPAGIGLDPTMASYFGQMPLPNNFASGDGLNTAAFSWNPPSSLPELRLLFRVDHKFNDNNSIFGRFTWTNSDTKEGDFLNSRPQVFPGFPPRGLVNRRPRNLALSYRRVFSPRLVNEFTTGYARFLFDFAFGRANPAFDPSLPSNGIPPFISPNISEPFNNQSGTARWLTTVQFIDNLSYTVNKHFLRGGINFRLVRHNDQRSFVGGVVNEPRLNFGTGRIPAPAANSSGAVSASNPFGIPSTCQASTNPGCVNGGNINSADQTRLRNMVSDMLGLPSSINQSYFGAGLNGYPPSGLYIRGVRYHQYDSYFQDEWKIRRNLTLNLGVRWEWNRPASEANDLILRPNKQIDDFASGLVTFEPRDTGWDRENANAIAPRIGLAWDPWSSGKTVFRAGYGISFDVINTFQLVPVLGLAPGASAFCAVTIQNTNTPATGSSNRLISSANCADPGGLDARISTGFPQELPQPVAPPSSFVSPTPSATSLAPFAGTIDPNIQNPTVHDWTLSVQRDLGKNIVLQGAYVGKRGTHLLRSYDKNQVKLDSAFLTSFNIARANLVQCGDPRGITCGQPVGLLLLLLPGTTMTSNTITGRLFSNAAGSLAALIDGNGIALTGVANLPGCTPARVPTTFEQMLIATGGVAGACGVTGGIPDVFRTNPQFGSIFYLDSSADSYYHSLQVTLRRQGRNVNFGLAYTLGKSIDNGSIDPVGATSGGNVGNNSSSMTDIRNFRADRGRSDFDRRQVLTGHVVWDLPFGKDQRWGQGASGWVNQLIGGWTATSIVTAMAGEPFSVLSGQLTNSNIRGSRVDLVSAAVPQTGIFQVSGIVGPVMFAPNDLPQINLNGSPFRIPAPGTNGNSGRNAFTGPAFHNVDFGITKKFTVTETINVQFRAEFFNAFNHPNFDNPLTSSDGVTTAFAGNTTTLTQSANFARLCCVSASTPSTTALISVGEAARVIQFALRLNF